jgi:hypothetical protein
MGKMDVPADGGVSSIQSWDGEPACTFDPASGFALNPRCLDTLRWYSHLSNQSENGAVS